MGRPLRFYEERLGSRLVQPGQRSHLDEAQDLVDGIGGGFAALAWLAYALLPTSMPEFALTPTISPETIVMAVAVGIGVVALAPALTWRRLTRMNLPAKLRVVE